MSENKEVLLKILIDQKEKNGYDIYFKENIALLLWIQKKHLIKLLKCFKGNFSGQVYKPGLEAYKVVPGDDIIYITSFHSLDKKIPKDVKTKLYQL